jgi:hypothetical protein
MGHGALVAGMGHGGLGGRDGARGLGGRDGARGIGDGVGFCFIASRVGNDGEGLLQGEFKKWSLVTKQMQRAVPVMKQTQSDATMSFSAAC